MARVWELAFAWLVLQALDVITTATALMYGGVELNPAMRLDPWALVALKVGVGVALVAAAFLLPARHERAARTGLAAGLVLAGGVVAWNLAMLVLLGGSA